MTRPGRLALRRLHLPHALALALAAVLASTCGSCRRERPPQEPAAPDTTAAIPAPAALRYQAYPIPDYQAYLKLVQEIGEERFGLVLKVNRLDPEHVREGDTLAVPRPLPELLDLSPFPERVPAAEGIPKLLLVSLRVQAFAAYESGKLVHWGPTSTGRQTSPTEPGLYHTNWKAVERRSTVSQEWLLRWYFNIGNLDGCSIHQYDLPGYPASHACIRMLDDDARWVWGWAEQWKLTADGRQVVAHGSPLVVFGDYDWAAPPPWKSLPADPAAASVSLAEAEEAIARWLPGGGAATATMADSL